MNDKRVRIVDIAEELGLSTATVSNVIHGKKEKVSSETIKRVEQLIEKREYIPSMAGILLARNSSHIIGVIINNHDKYENRVLQDPFMYGSVDFLSEAIQKAGFEMMLKMTQNIEDVVRFASMWNMSGLIMIGFCTQDYENIRGKMHIPLVVYDGNIDKKSTYGNVAIDDFDGGYQMGKFMIQMGHKKVMYIADNLICMDAQRYFGFKKAYQESDIELPQDTVKLVPYLKEDRIKVYEELFDKLNNYTAAFCASDAYAIEWINFLEDQGIRVGKDFSVAGFDDIPESILIRPKLTTIHQSLEERAQQAIGLINLQGKTHVANEELDICIPVQLIQRESVCDLYKSNKI